MAIFDKDLIVFHDDNSVFADKSFEANNYITDSFALELDSANDYIYIGLFKPFDNLYVEMSTAATSANTFTAEYYNGTAFTAVSNFVDSSKGFTRSGFLRWSKGTDWASTIINSETLFWIRLRPSVTHDVGTIVQGLNTVFSDDNDLAEDYRDINSFLCSPDVSFIATHQSVRKDIIQKIRNQGTIKTNSATSSALAEITQWDLLNIDQLRSASKYYVLEKVFFNSSDSVDGKYFQLSRDYKIKGDEAFNLFLLTIDKDNDGTLDSNESQPITYAKVTRL